MYFNILFFLFTSFSTENNMVDINNVSGENNSLPLLIPEDQNIEMKNDENIGQNLSDFTNVHTDMKEIS